MDDQNIVEIYSAANPFEAQIIANALETAGVKARVVGDWLSMAGGELPLGQPIAPRIWVLQEDEARARELIEQLKAEAGNTPETIE